MRNVILGTVAGLVLGTAGALAYSHFVNDGQLADLQAQLDAANAKLAKEAQDKQQLASETSSVSDQIDQLQATNADLKKQLDEAKKASAASTSQEINPLTLADMMRGMMRGGFQGQQQRLFLLQHRLNLTPDQAAAIKAAMESDARIRTEIARQMFRGGKLDPADAAKANTLDQTVATVLTPEQQTAYRQVQAEEQAGRADTMATMQMNQMAPLLQLSDSQKDQVEQALYQVQASAPDPASLVTNPSAPLVIMAQAQATQTALSKVLSQEQLDLYQQEGQAMAQARNGANGARGGGNGGNGGNGGGGNGGGNNPGGAPAGNTAPAVSPSTAPPPPPQPPSQ